MAKIQPGARCPTASAPWALQPATRVSSARLTRLLSRYCAYQFLGGPDEVPASQPTLARNDVVQRLEPDYPIVLPQGDEYTRGTAQAHHATFRQQLEIGRIGEILPTKDRPYVAIVDTVDRNPSGRWSDDPADHHGLTMGGIVRTIRCSDDDPDCDPRLIYAQAFPESLGDRGSVWSLNLAVIDAIEQWRGLGSDAPLVLNMSVGWAWDPANTQRLDERYARLLNDFEGVVDHDISVAEEALFLTLAWASCQDVLAVAAAGNTRGGACSESGPMAPAAWEQLTPLGFDQCEELLDPIDHAGLGSKAEFGADHDLVYSAGGIDADNAPIVNARPLSEPNRVLYASRTSVPVGDGEYSSALTGTSVASASLAGIAAQYWSVHPTLSAAEVIGNLTQSCQADAVDGECADPGDTVPLIRASTVLPDHYGPVPITLVNTQLVATPTPSINTIQLVPPQPNGAFGSRACTTYSFVGAPSASAVSWPDLVPQPQNPICPTCSLNYTADDVVLYIDIIPDYRTDLNDPRPPRVDSTFATLELFLPLPSGSVTQVDLNLTNHSACFGWPCTVALSSFPHPNSSNSTDKLSDYIRTANVRAATIGFHVTTNGTTELVSGEIDVFNP